MEQRGAKLQWGPKLINANCLLAHIGWARILRAARLVKVEVGGSKQTKWPRVCEPKVRFLGHWPPIVCIGTK